MLQFEKKSATRLVMAYNLMIGAMRDAFNGRQRSSMTLRRALDIARDEVTGQGVLTDDEAMELIEYIKMDVNDSAELMMEFCSEFYEWLSLDIDIVERKVMDMFLSVADNTRSIIDHVQHGPVLLAESPVSRLKRLVGPRRLICAQCGLGRESGSTAKTCEACGHGHFISAGKGLDR